VKILELAEQIRNLTSGRSDIGCANSPKDDPEVPCPDIWLAVSTLEWKPTIFLEDGLTHSIEWGRGAWSEA
jgi:UDP-glucuronate decarboxylase